MVVQIVRFKSALSDDELLRTSEARAPRYRALRGLLQKYYLRYPETDEYGAVYVWDSEDSLAEFRRSELARTIPEAYQVQGTPKMEVAEVAMLLREKEEAATSEPGARR